MNENETKSYRNSLTKLIESNVRDTQTKPQIIRWQQTDIDYDYGLLAYFQMGS